MACAIRFNDKKPSLPKPSFKNKLSFASFPWSMGAHTEGSTQNVVRIVPSMPTTVGNLLAYANSLSQPEFLSSCREMLPVPKRGSLTADFLHADVPLG